MIMNLSILTVGEFGRSLKRSLSESSDFSFKWLELHEISPDMEIQGYLVIVCDYVDKRLFGQISTMLNVTWSYCTIESRTLVYSPDFRDSVCFDCFDTRWLSNMDLRTHSPYLESKLRGVYSNISALAVFPFPDSVYRVVGALIVKNALISRRDFQFDCFDIITGEYSAEWFLPVSGCKSCKEST